MSVARERPPTRAIGLLLVEGFALMSYASVVEAFRAANVLAGAELYRWTHVSTRADAVRASNGASVLAECKVGEPLGCDTLFVFAGGDPASFDDAATFSWLRQIAHRGATMAGVSGGPFLLARAGLLDGHRATIHWDHRESFAEHFPMLQLEGGLYVIDRRRVTCAGGIAGLDLAIELIEREHGQALAARVGDWFIRAEPRGATRPQRLSLRERYGIANDRLLKVLARMETSVEEPLSRGALAATAKVSVRQLERLFADHLGRTIGEHYLALRLDQAKQLLRKTAMPVTAVAVACGFNSGSHFSRAFKARHGHAPSRDRD